MTSKDSEVAAPKARGEWRYAKQALAWHGWGSPIGLAGFVLALAAAAVLIRLALYGW